MTDAETRTAIATSGETRASAEFDEIVLGDVSIPVRSIQRTDTSRFEGKVTFGDYTADSDQLMSTWAQTSWVGGMLVADHEEGATDQRFRWARAWTQTGRAMALPLASVASPSLSPYGSLTAGDRYFPWGEGTDADTRYTIPLGADGADVIAASGSNLYRWQIDGLAPTSPSGTMTLLGALADGPVNTGRRYTDPTGAASDALWIPLGESGIQAYNPTTGTIHPVDATVPAIAVETLRNAAGAGRLYAITRTNWTAPTHTYAGGGDLLYLDSTGTWSAAAPTRSLPYDEVPLDLTTFYDRNGNQVVVVLTTKQVWYYQEDADALVPLGLGPNTVAGMEPYAFASWRDDGLYVGKGHGIVRLSGAGVITFVGLDRDDGIDPREGEVLPNLYHLVPTINSLMTFAVNREGGGLGLPGRLWSLLGWTEAGWHFIANQYWSDYDGAEVPLPTRSIVVVDQGQEVLVTGVAARGAGGAAPADYSLNLTATYLPVGNHSPRLGAQGWAVRYSPYGSYYSGWFDAGMRNFYKAWSHVEVFLATPRDGAASPSGTVTVEYRTDDDPDTWVTLGTTSRYGRNVFQMPTAASDVGVTSLKIELRLSLDDTSGSGPLQQSPVIDAVILKFIKVAQQGSAWQAYVALSDYELWRGLGPTQIDDYLSRLTSEGSADGPFVTMIHKRDVDGEPATHRVRVAQWQRSEMPGDVPAGDGVLSIIAVPIAEIPGA